MRLYQFIFDRIENMLSIRFDSQDREFGGAAFDVIVHTEGAVRDVALLELIGFERISSGTINALGRISPEIWLESSRRWRQTAAPPPRAFSKA